MVANEKELIESLDAYKLQLNHVEETLKIGSSDDLLELKQDIIQLIQLTEESLLALKKSNLLAYLDEQINTTNNSKVLETGNASSFTNKNNDDDDDEDDGEEDNNGGTNSDDHDDDARLHGEDGLYGMKCRVPYIHGWGEMGYHNAVVFCGEAEEDKVRVIFCNPTHHSMKLCPYFVEGTCKFDDHQCRLSHGYVVDVSLLLPFQEPHFESMKVGSSCLAKDDDDELWYRGVVVDVITDVKNVGDVTGGEDDDDDDEVVARGGGSKVKVMFDDHRVLDLDLHDIFPISDDVGDCDEIGKVTDTNIANEDENEDGMDGYASLYPTSSSSSSQHVDAMGINIQTSDVLGGWEQHTKGIGSKLMLKMGYVLGEGLGKNNDGRAVPVPINILPIGKSLDRIMEMKGKSMNKNMFRVNLDKTKSTNSSAKMKSRANVFDMLNRNFSRHHRLEKKKQPSTRANEQKHISTQDLSRRSDKHINIQLLKTADELRRSNEEMRRLKDSHARNVQSGDKVTAKKIETKIQSLITYQEQLKTSEKFMDSQKKSRKAHKELTKF